MTDNFFTQYTDSSAVFLFFPIIPHNCLGSCDVFLRLFSPLYTPASPSLTCCNSRSLFQTIAASDVSRIPVLHPPAPLAAPEWPFMFLEF